MNHTRNFNDGYIDCSACYMYIEFGVETNCHHICCGNCLMNLWRRTRFSLLPHILCPYCNRKVTRIHPNFTEEENNAAALNEAEARERIRSSINEYNEIYKSVWHWFIYFITFKIKTAWSFLLTTIIFTMKSVWSFLLTTIRNCADRLTLTNSGTRLFVKGVQIIPYTCIVLYNIYFLIADYYFSSNNSLAEIVKNLCLSFQNIFTLLVMFLVIINYCCLWNPKYAWSRNFQCFTLPSDHRV